MNNREKAWQQYEVAKYLLKTTYPAVKDPKLLVTILTNIHNSLNEAMGHLIGPNLSYREKIAYMQRKGFQTTFIQKINEIMELHQTSPIEFSKQGKFVICSPDYKMRHLDIKNIEEFLEQNKIVLDQIDKFLIESNK
jgi:hypothetical protein